MGNYFITMFVDILLTSIATIAFTVGMATLFLIGFFYLLMLPFYFVKFGWDFVNKKD